MFSVDGNNGIPVSPSSVSMQLVVLCELIISFVSNSYYKLSNKKIYIYEAHMNYSKMVDEKRIFYLSAVLYCTLFSSIYGHLYSGPRKPSVPPKNVCEFDRCKGKNGPTIIGRYQGLTRLNGVMVIKIILIYIYSIPSS
jgi:hypothetical protein